MFLKKYRTRTNVKKNIYWIIFLLLSFIIFEASVYAFNRSESFLFRAASYFSYDALVDKAGEFYENKNLKPRTEDYFLVQIAAEHNEDFSKRVSSNFLGKENKKDPFRRILNKSDSARDLSIKREVQYLDEFADFIAWNSDILGNKFYTVDEEYAEFLNDPWDDLMLKALYCDISGYDEMDFFLLSLINDEKGGYLDTHFLLGLLLLKENRCFNEERISEGIEKVIGEIVAAQKSDQKFSDLYAERIVFLYWAGHGDLVEKEWISKVKRNFKKDDLGWRDIGESMSNPHTTGLSILALIYFSEGETAQKFYK